MRAKAALTSAAEPRPSSTPPTSLLWTACGDSTLSAAGKPTRAASSAASSALCGAMRDGDRDSDRVENLLGFDFR